jgi:hypothetical protein
MRPTPTAHMLLLALAVAALATLPHARAYVYKLDLMQDVGTQLKAQQTTWRNQGLASHVEFGGELYFVLPPDQWRPPNVHDYTPMRRGITLPEGIQHTLTIGIYAPDLRPRDLVHGFRMLRRLTLPTENDAADPFYIHAEAISDPEREAAFSTVSVDQRGRAETLFVHFYQSRTKPISVSVTFSVLAPMETVAGLDYTGYTKRHGLHWLAECQRVAARLAESDNPAVDIERLDVLDALFGAGHRTAGVGKTT